MNQYAVLKGERNYFKRLGENVITRFADSIDKLVFSWMMYEVTGSASMAALFLFFNFLPTTLFQPFLGVIIEQMQKKYVIIVCDIGRAAIVAGTLLAYRTGVLSGGLLIGLTLCISTLEAFNRPANTSFLPFLLKEEKYSAGIALDNSMARVAELVGTGVGGVAISAVGVTGALAVDLGGFLISAALTLTIRGREAVARVSFTWKGYRDQFVDGLRALKGLRTVCVLMLVAAFINLCLSPLNSFQSAYVVDSLRFGPEMLSMMGVAISLGMGLGAAAGPQFSGRVKLVRVIFWVGLLQSLSMLGYWGIPYVGREAAKGILIVLASFLLGLSSGLISVLASTKIVSDIPKSHLARVISVTSAVTTVTVPLGALICSGLALAVPVQAIYLLFAGLMLAFYLVISRLGVLQDL